MLISELQGHEQEQRGLEIEMQGLNDRLQQMEQQQQNMVSFVARALQKPGLALNLVPQLEVHDRKRRLPRIACDDGSIDENQRATSQALSVENVGSNSAVASNMELFEQLESSLTFWENSLVMEVGETHTEHNSTMELDESTSCAESPAISCVQLNIDVRPKSPGIDMNSEPAALLPTEPVPAREQRAGAAPTAATGVNDVFWEQFLTENPGSTDNQEVQSERKGADGRKNEIKPGDHWRFWWSIRNVNNLTEQMEHLASAGRT